MLLSIAFAVALMAAEPAAAPAAAPAAKEKKADPNAVVCKKEPVLGSRMSKKTCLTEAEWEQRRIDGRDSVDAAQRNRGG